VFFPYKNLLHGSIFVIRITQNLKVMEKVSYHNGRSSSVSELAQNVVGTILYIAVMALGICFFVRLLTL